MIKYKPIGVIHSPFKGPKGTPIQPTAAKDIEGTVEIFSEFVDGLKDIDGFSYIILIYSFHLIHNKSQLIVKPFMDDNAHGIFATRAPNRPNSIGLSIVKLVKVKKNILYIKDVDIVNNTPLLDIKPYVPKFDQREVKKIGWVEKNDYKLQKSKDDGRFL